jgi:cytochrome c553
MREQPLFSLRNPWFATSVIITAAIVLIAGAFGFIWLPLMERNTSFSSVWTAICSAAGLTQPASAGGAIVEPAVKLSQVVLTPGEVAPSNAAAIGHGGTLARTRCSMCHGTGGAPTQATIPNLAGHSAGAIYKQLQDFKSGARVSAIMTAMIGALTTQDMQEIADYYASLPRPSRTPPGPGPTIVESGAPLRGIAPCGTCHGQEGHKLGAPWLQGQSVPYLRAQLLAFKSGERHNDIDDAMRNVARQMTPEEIDASAQFYGVRPEKH